MKSFILTGDLIYCGKVEVFAETKEEAILKAEDGEFSVFERYPDDVMFTLDSTDEDHIEELDIEQEKFKELKKLEAAQRDYDHNAR